MRVLFSNQNTGAIRKMAALFFLTGFLFSCQKEQEVVQPIDQVKNYLVGMGNRYWKISKLSINNVEQPLSLSQQQYYRTYMIDISQPAGHSGTFTDSDGYKGDWELKGVSDLSETIKNNQTGHINYNKVINSISANSLDITYTANSISTRIVYWAP